MTTYRYTPGMQIANTDQLPRGTGAKYLEVLVPCVGPLIAVQWRRTKPRKLQAGRALVEFSRKAGAT